VTEKGRPEDWTAPLVSKPAPKPFLTASRLMKRCSMDSLSALQAFVRAAEFRSFTDAGRELRLSSSAVGKAISRLEERHGVRLFNRSTRSITLTHEGQLLLESCRRIFSEIENVEQEFAETKGAPKGKLRISMPVLGGVAASRLAWFLHVYPDIELDVDFAERPAEVIDGGYDVVVRAGDVDDSRLMSRRVGSYRPALVCSPSYLDHRAGEPDRAEDLISHACLHLKDTATGKLQPWPFASPKMSNVSLQVTAVANATEALIVFAELGMGIACVPDFTVRRQLADGSLRRILRGCLEEQVSLRAIWPSSRFPSPKLRAFIDFLARHGFVSSDCAMIDQDSAACSLETTNATAGRAKPVHPIPSKTDSTVISLNM
jgi:DNA-binding transcriptional LysR family regulator